jgi:hypothetical protein
LTDDATSEERPTHGMNIKETIIEDGIEPRDAGGLVEGGVRFPFEISERFVFDDGSPRVFGKMKIVISDSGVMNYV